MRLFSFTIPSVPEASTTMNRLISFNYSYFVLFCLSVTQLWFLLLGLPSVFTELDGIHSNVLSVIPSICICVLLWGNALVKYPVTLYYTWIIGVPVIIFTVLISLASEDILYLGQFWFNYWRISVLFIMYTAMILLTSSRSHWRVSGGVVFPILMVALYYYWNYILGLHGHPLVGEINKTTPPSGQFLIISALQFNGLLVSILLGGHLASRHSIWRVIGIPFLVLSVVGVASLKLLQQVNVFDALIYGYLAYLTGVGVYKLDNKAFNASYLEYTSISYYILIIYGILVHLEDVISYTYVRPSFTLGIWIGNAYVHMAIIPKLIAGLFAMFTLMIIPCYALRRAATSLANSVNQFIGCSTTVVKQFSTVIYFLLVTLILTCIAGLFSVLYALYMPATLFFDQAYNFVAIHDVLNAATSQTVEGMVQSVTTPFHFDLRSNYVPNWTSHPAKHSNIMAAINSVPRVTFDNDDIIRELMVRAARLDNSLLEVQAELDLTRSTLEELRSQK